jgi:hypothetical protein
MTKPKETAEPDKQGVGHTLTEDNGLKAWEHFASTGGADKTTMVTVASWLLAFSSAIIGYAVTDPLKSDSFVFPKLVAMLFLAGIGVFTSIAAGFVAFLYGGYASNNWAKADELAKTRGWDELLPNGSKAVGQSNKDSKDGLAARFVRRRNCSKRLAPIFKIFMALAIMSSALQLVFLFRSISLIRSTPPAGSSSALHSQNHGR